MKILHIVSSYWPAFKMGGPIKSVHELNKWLVKKGVEVTVYTTNAGLKDENIVLKKNFDLIHITGVWNFPVLVAAFLARFYKKPYIISSRGSLMKEPLEKKSSLIKKNYLSLIAKRDLEYASALHFTVEVEKEEYLKAGLPLKKAIVIPNGLDIEDYEIRNQYENTK